MRNLCAGCHFIDMNNLALNKDMFIAAKSNVARTGYEGKKKTNRRRLRASAPQSLARTKGKVLDSSHNPASDGK